MYSTFPQLLTKFLISFGMSPFFRSIIMTSPTCRVRPIQLYRYRYLFEIYIKPIPISVSNRYICFRLIYICFKLIYVSDTDTDITLLNRYRYQVSVSVILILFVIQAGDGVGVRVRVGAMNKFYQYLHANEFTVELGGKLELKK